MSEKKIHFAKSESCNETYQVFYKNELILESNQTLKVKEHYDGNDFPPVIYFPKSSLSALAISRTDHTSHCPIKGEASYWSYQDAANGIWSYERPLQEMESIKEHFGFDRNKGFRIEPKGTD